MNGIPVEQHLGRTVREVVPWNAPTVEPILQKVLATGEPVLNVEVTGETPCQPGIQRHWMESFFPIAGADGSPNAVGAIVVEITERKRAEEALRESEQRLRTAIETSPDGIVLVELDGSLLMTNRQAALLGGFRDVGELFASGKSGFDFLTPEDWQRVQEKMGELMEKDIVRNMELQVCRIDGRRIPVEVNASLQRNAQGEPKAMLVAVRDISDRKRGGGLPAAGQGSRRGRQPRQERVPGQHEPRDPHAHDGDSRLQRPAHGSQPALPGTARVPRRGFRETGRRCWS